MSVEHTAHLVDGDSSSKRVFSYTSADSSTTRAFWLCSRPSSTYVTPVARPSSSTSMRVTRADDSTRSRPVASAHGITLTFVAPLASMWQPLAMQNPQ
jgi:hypothetical protein